jgi:hypothetical protein
MDNGVFAVEQWLAGAAVFSTPDAPFEIGPDVYRCSYSKMSDAVDCKGRKVTTYRELSLVRCLPLLPGLRRIGQGHAPEGCPDPAPLPVQA